jgi:PTS system D-glucosamine-specific IIC component
VTVIKSNLEDYLVTAPDITYAVEEAAPAAAAAAPKDKTAGQKVVKTVVISSPVTGVAADLSTAPDEGFAGKMMGDGAVVTPTDAIVKAPVDGTVTFVFDTKHAIGFTTDSGLEMLLHIGIDTVKLNGQGFEVFVENGQKVKKGDSLMKLDLDFLKANAPSVTSPILCTNLEDNQKVRLLKNGAIKAGEDFFAVDFYG